MGKILTCIVVAVSVAGSLASAAGAQPPAQRSVFERYTEPIQIFKTGLGTFTKPISSTNKEAQAFFDQGFQMMYAFAKPEAVRSFRESWKRDAELRDLLLGRGVGVGVVPERADERPRRRRTPTRRSRRRCRSKSARRRRRSARSSTRWRVRYVEKFDAPKRVEQDRAYADAMEKVAGAVSRTISRSRRSTPTRCSCSSRGAARATSTIPTCSGCTTCSSRSSPNDVHHPGACHLYVHATESTVVPGRARGVRRVPRHVDPGREPHQSHAVAHVERGRPVGRLGARQPRGVAFGSEGGDRRGLRDLSGAQPAHAALRRVDTTARARSRCRPARTTRS